MKVIHHQSQPASTPEQDNVELPPMITIHQQTPALLSIPLEIRLRIYDLCFFQDHQNFSIHTRKVRSGIGWKDDRPSKYDFHEFDLLLVNHQIHNEAAALAYAAQRHRLIQSHPTYYLSPTPLTSKSFKKWTWELQSQWVWQPSCRSAKGLARLRLPKLGLAFRDPYRYGVYARNCTMYRKKNLVTEDQVDALKIFFRSLAYHLRQENVTKSIDIYLEGHSHKFLECIFRASEGLLTSRAFARSRETQYEVVYLSDDLPFVENGESIMRNLVGKARMWHWMEAPEEFGRRMPEDIVSGYHLRELKDFLENRGGRWEDWHVWCLSQQ